MTPKDLALVLAGVWCVLTAAGVLLTGLFQGKTRERLRSLPAGMVAGLFLIGMVALIGSDLSFFWPKGGFQWLVWLSVGCLGLALIEGWWRLKPVFVVGISTFLIVGGLVLIGENRWSASTRGWTLNEATGWIGLSAGIALLNMISGLWVQSVRGSRTVLVGWTLTIFLGAGIVGLLGKSERLATLMLVLGGVSAGLMLVSLIWRGFEPSASLWLTLSALLTGIISAAMDPWYAYLPIPQAVLLLGAPSICWVALLADPSRMWKPILIVVLMVIAVLSWPLAESVQTYQQYRAMGLIP